MEVFKELCIWMVKASLAGPALSVGEPDGPPNPKLPVTLEFSSKNAAWPATKTAMDSEAVEKIAPYMRGSTYDEQVGNAQSLTAGLDEAAWQLLHSRNSESEDAPRVPQSCVPTRLTSAHVVDAYWMAFLAKGWEAPGCADPMVDVLKAELLRLVRDTLTWFLNSSMLCQMWKRLVCICLHCL